MRLAQLAASFVLCACAAGPSASYDAGSPAEPSLSEAPREPREAPQDEPPASDHDLDSGGLEDTADASVGDFETSHQDASTPQGSEAAPYGGQSEGVVPTRPARCQAGRRSAVALSVPEHVDGTVTTDARFIYYRSLISEDPARHEIAALPRALLTDPTLVTAPVSILNDDYALGPLADGGDGYLFFIAMRGGDDTNQGLFRVQKRERAAIESVPVHAQADDDHWPGQLAVDESSFYLASSGPSSRTLRILRFSRAGYQREVLWHGTGDDDAEGGLSLREGDIAVDADHVYFNVRVNRERPPHDFRVYRLEKRGANQTAELVTTLRESYGALATDGVHLFFNHQGNLEQLEIASGAREQLVRQQSMRDLSYADGVLSWTPADHSDANLLFLCL